MDDIDEVEIEIDRDIEEDYKEEFGYFLVILLKGNTTGRRLKRTVFKSGVSQLLCGFSLMVLAIRAGYTEIMDKYFVTPNYGASLHDLQWLISFPSMLLGVGSMIMIYYWASLCTNRTLLKAILNIYMMINLFFFIFTLWLICALGLTYRVSNIDWRDNKISSQMLGCVIFTFIFTIAYFITIVLYTLDLSYYSEELEYSGIRLLEPYEPEVDLSEMDLSVACVEAFAVPCTYLIQAFDMFMSCYRQILRYLAYRRRKAAELERQRGKIKNTIWHRLRKTSFKLYTIGLAMYHRYKQRFDDYRRDRQEKYEKTEEIKLLQKSQEINDRMERERQQLEEERKKRLEHELWKKQIEEDHRKEQEEFKLLEEGLALQEEEKKRQEEEKKRKEEEEKTIKMMPTLSVQQFKSLWGSLATSGQFQCKLKASPSLMLFSEHIKKQGFHIVYATNPTSSDIELGICNIRSVGNEAWFLARFVASSSSFSAIMKAEMPDEVASHVKKFGLAKILKIDTSQ